MIQYILGAGGGGYSQDMKLIQTMQAVSDEEYVLPSTCAGVPVLVVVGQ